MMSTLRAAMGGTTTAPFSSPCGTRRLTIRVGAAASTIIRCNGAGGKTRHAARKPHVRFSNRPFGVKRFQTIHHCGVDVAQVNLATVGLSAKWQKVGKKTQIGSNEMSLDQFLDTPPAQ